ncbi:MAG: LamG domain-containing protein [Planctomycetes bacterium]|nr:LamG domain-containing protein [Planctomycetota bacterium]
MWRKLIYLICFVLMLSITGNASAELVAYWTFDEGSGDIIYDSSGNDNNGTISGAQWDAGKYGNALQFNGQDNYVEVPNSESLEIATNVSIAAWIYWIDAGDGWQGILSKGPMAGPGENYSLFVNRSGRFFHFVLALDVGRVQQNSPNDSVVPDEWQHVCCTWDGSVTRIYINGEVAMEMDQVATIIPSELPLRIGHREASSHYWNGILDEVRIYNHALSEAEVLAAMEGSKGYPFAFGPVPKDTTLHEDTWINLSWWAGDFAASHDVYIGDNFDDVNAGVESTFQGNQTDNFFVVGFPGFAYPDGLVPGTTYYWRIDEVNEAEPNSPWKGDIWSFSIPPKTAYFPDPADGAEGVDPQGTLSWTPGFGSKLHTVYFGNNFDDVSNAAGGLPQGAASYSPGELKQAKTYYWRVDEFDATDTFKGNVWSFTTEGAVAVLEPANGAVDITQTPVLTWAPGLGSSHEVYFGADEASLELKGSGNLGSESYESGELEWYTTYYWRIDEANNANADSPWTGPLWSFTTANFLIIDDMEGYNDLDPADPASNRIFNAWLDGFGDQTNGSTVGHLDPPFYEQTIVHSGNKSMPFSYDNGAGKSEAILTLTSNRDWTVNGVNTLTLWYRGDTANAVETMYVILNGTAGVNNDNPEAAQSAVWTEWNIDLQAFADQGVNLANVTSITLGLGNRTNPSAGGAGMMYFDDIRLYAQ